MLVEPPRIHLSEIKTNYGSSYRALHTYVVIASYTATAVQQMATKVAT